MKVAPSSYFLPQNFSTCADKNILKIHATSLNANSLSRNHFSYSSLIFRAVTVATKFSLDILGINTSKVFNGFIRKSTPSVETLEGVR
jgi:hypothetical protein